MNKIFSIKVIKYAVFSFFITMCFLGYSVKAIDVPGLGSEPSNCNAGEIQYFISEGEEILAQLGKENNQMSFCCPDRNWNHKNFECDLSSNQVSGDGELDKIYYQEFNNVYVSYYSKDGRLIQSQEMDVTVPVVCRNWLKGVGCLDGKDKCAAGKGYNNSDDCSGCSAGKYNDGSYYVCRSCKTYGSGKDDNYVIDSLSGSRVYKYISASGASECSKCRDGQYANDNNTGCVTVQCSDKCVPDCEGESIFCEHADNSDLNVYDDVKNSLLSDSEDLDEGLDVDQMKDSNTGNELWDNLCHDYSVDKCKDYAKDACVNVILQNSEEKYGFDSIEDKDALFNRFGEDKVYQACFGDDDEKLEWLCTEDSDIDINDNDSAIVAKACAGYITPKLPEIVENNLNEALMVDDNPDARCPMNTAAKKQDCRDDLLAACRETIGGNFFNKETELNLQLLVSGFSNLDEYCPHGKDDAGNWVSGASEYQNVEKICFDKNEACALSINENFLESNLETKLELVKSEYDNIEDDDIIISCDKFENNNLNTCKEILSGVNNCVSWLREIADGYGVDREDIISNICTIDNASISGKCDEIKTECNQVNYDQNMNTWTVSKDNYLANTAICSKTVDECETDLESDCNSIWGENNSASICDSLGFEQLCETAIFDDVCKTQIESGLINSLVSEYNSVINNYTTKDNCISDDFQSNCENELISACSDYIDSNDVYSIENYGFESEYCVANKVIASKSITERCENAKNNVCPGKIASDTDFVINKITDKLNQLIADGDSDISVNGSCDLCENDIEDKCKELLDPDSDNKDEFLSALGLKNDAKICNDRRGRRGIIPSDFCPNCN